MIKIVAAIRRRAGVTREALINHWETVHAPNVVRHTSPERYALTYFDQDYDGAAPPYDGLAELWFRDRTAITELTETIESLPDDGFLDLCQRDRMVMVTGRERVIVPS